MYSILSDTIKVLDEEGYGEIALGAIDEGKKAWIKVFLGVPFSKEELFAVFWLVEGVSVEPFLLVVAGRAYSSSSDVGRI